MEYLEYKQEFWKRALELVDGPPVCEQCKVVRNMAARPRIVVRLVLTGNGKPMPGRLRMLCTTCYRDPVPIRFTKKQILSAMGNLFEHAPEKKERRSVGHAHTNPQTQGRSGTGV